MALTTTSRGLTGRVGGLVAAGLAAALLTAGCGGGNTASADNGGSGNRPIASATGDIHQSIKGKKLVFMIQSQPDPSKVVEVHAANLLKQEGVDVEVKWNPSTSSIAAAQLASGDIDVWAVSLSGGLTAAQAGQPFVDFSLLQPRQDYVMLSRPDITSLAALKGKKIGVIDTTGANYLQMLIALQSVGLKASDVSTVQAGGQSSRLSALISGRLDATELSHSAALKLPNYHVLYDYTKQSPDLSDDNAWATKDWLQKNPDLAVAFNEAILESFAWFDDPANADTVVNEAMQIQTASDKTVLKQLFDTLRQNSWCPEGAILDVSSVDKQQQEFKQIGMIEQTTPVEQWADATYAEQAKNDLGK